MSIERIALRLVGVGPMLMHSSRLGDPLDPTTKAIASITSKSKKTEADHARIAELEWHGGLWLSEGRPCLPPHCINAVLVDGARQRKKTEMARAAFVADGPSIIEYDGPKTIPQLWADERFRHREMVRVRYSLLARTRPCFPQWGARITATFLTSMINRARSSSYNALLDVYEPGSTIAALQPIFAQLKARLVPLLSRITGSHVLIDDSILRHSYDQTRQLQFGRPVLTAMGYDFERGRLDLSVHPFTTSFHPTDVRVTTRVYERELAILPVQLHP